MKRIAQKSATIGHRALGAAHLLLALLLSFAAACDTVEAPGKIDCTETPSAPECIIEKRTSRVTIKLNRFHVVKNCNGSPGDFHLYASASSSDTLSTSVTSRFNGSVNDDDLIDINKELAVELPEASGSKFSIYFRSYERDPNGFDARMGQGQNAEPARQAGDARTTVTHEWTSKGWTNLAGAPGVANYIRHGSGDCRATLSYFVEID